jgi:ATP phosphoribosyltransferase regulatory subunit
LQPANGEKLAVMVFSRSPLGEWEKVAEGRMRESPRAMPGKSPSERAALERQNAAIMAVFERAGFEHIQPDILQPADLFLESSGEDIRAKTYVFTDPSGAEMCLRPDLTVPACRYHLSHAPSPGTEARYCYLGPAFRFPNETEAPGEFTQAGLEWYGGGDFIAAEARVLKLTIGALEAAGLSNFKVTLGDLGLFFCLLDDMPMPARWRQRLRRQFWRPHAFRELLDSYAASGRRGRTSISPLVDALASADPIDAVRAHLAAHGLPLSGGRTEADIAERLAEKYADRSEQPITEDMHGAITRYLAIAGAATGVPGELEMIGRSAAYDSAREAYEKRLDALEDQGLNPRRFAFSATFGRELEYYTGFVFQIEAGGVVIAGGGRYDNLMAEIGSPVPVDAVGSAIYTDRLKAALA